MRRIRSLVFAGLVVAAMALPLQAEAAVVVPSSPAAIRLGSITMPDPEVAVGNGSSVAVGTDGLPVIAYHTSSLGTALLNLRVAHCNDQACTSVTTTDIDTVGDVGRDSSIKIGSDGLALISYRDRKNGAGIFAEDLKVAHCNDIACTSATITTLDAPARVAAPTSLTIGADGLGLISYLDFPPLNTTAHIKVKVAHCINLACTSATLTTVVTFPPFNPGGDRSMPARIATAGNGFGIIAYTGGADTRLRVAACTNADCSTKVISVVDGSPGIYASVTVGVDGFALISYRGSGGLQVAHCSNILCTQSTRTIADNSGSLFEPAIAISGDGLGVISYYDDQNKDQKVAHCANLTCSTATNKTVDAFGNVGQGPSITVGTDGLPLISSQGEGTIPAPGLNLRVLHCGNADCTAPISKPF